MQPHIHLGFIDGVKVFAVVVIYGFFWRTLASIWHANAFGRAMAFVY